MNYRTRWAYLRFETRIKGFAIIPQIITEACIGKGDGSKILTEAEGEVLEALIAAEQGILKFYSVADLLVFFSIDQIEMQKTLRSIENKGFAKFKEEFYII